MPRPFLHPSTAASSALSCFSLAMSDISRSASARECTQLSLVWIEWVCAELAPCTRKLKVPDWKSAASSNSSARAPEGKPRAVYRVSLSSWRARALRAGRTWDEDGHALPAFTRTLASRRTQSSRACAPVHNDHTRTTGECKLEVTQASETFLRARGRSGYRLPAPQPWAPAPPPL
jgi:hypothetical protein